MKFLHDYIPCFENCGLLHISSEIRLGSTARRPLKADHSQAIDVQARLFKPCRQAKSTLNSRAATWLQVELNLQKLKEKRRKMFDVSTVVHENMVAT